MIGDSQLIRIDFRTVLEEGVNGEDLVEAKAEDADYSIEEDDIG
jgi:hypothetical protein